MPVFFGLFVLDGLAVEASVVDFDGFEVVVSDLFEGFVADFVVVDFAACDV